MKTKLVILLVAFGAIVSDSFGQINNKNVNILRRELKDKFSILVKDMSGDNYSIAYNIDKGYVPASVVKLLTTGSALKILSPSYRFATDVYIKGYVKGRTLYGDLLIRGGGDPTIDSHYFPDREGIFLDSLALSLNKYHIDSIKGKIVVDGSRYGKNGVCRYWGSDDIGNYYGVGAYGFNLFDNYYDLYAKVEGNRVSLLNSGYYDWVTFVNKLRPDRRYSSDEAFSQPMVDKITLSGGIRVSDTVNLKPAMPNPLEYAGIYIKRSLLSKKIIVMGDVAYDYTGKYSYNRGDKMILRYLSPELSDIVRVTNHVSHNMFAEVLSRELSLVCNGLDRVSYESPRAVVSFWREKLATKKNYFHLDDGCGLSRTDRLTPRTLANVLSFLFNDKDISKSFISSLPIAGKIEEKNNSVRKLKTTNKYLLRIKSGSMRGVKSYAGLIEYKGKKYIIVFMSNGVNGKMASNSFMNFVNKTFK